MTSKVKQAAVLFFFLMGACGALGQEGSLDPSFNPSDVGFGKGDGFNNYTYAVALQPDGKVIVGGIYTSFNGTPRNGIARLTSSGDLDTGFNPGTGASNGVMDIALQPDGKILIGGGFTSYNGTARNYIARLNSDGTLDNAFNAGAGANGSVLDVLLQPDGKILIGGAFTSYNGTARNRIARLNSDGTLDTGFDPGAGANSLVHSVARQPDGKILIGGQFSTVNGSARNRIARLNTDGSLDGVFNPGSGANNTVFACAVQVDGKILIGGLFTTFQGITHNRIARLNADGTLDAGFISGSGANDYVRTIILQPDGKALIGGRFVTYNGTVRNRLARLSTDGTLDSTFDPGQGANEYIYSIALQPDGKLLITGDMWLYQGTMRGRIVRVTSTGGLDATFNVVSGASQTVSCLAFQPDGKILIGGWFDNYNGIARNRIARLNSDGSLDSSFDPGSGANSAVCAIVLQPDGRILIGGFFTAYNGTPRYHVARLNSNGSLDTSFDLGNGTDYQVLSIALQPNGKILIAGAFTSVTGTPNHIARLNSDGSLDTGFDPGYGTDDHISKVLVQPDGKILIGGDFTLCDSIPRNRVARLTSNGEVDPTFDPGTGTDASVFDIALQPDGKILIAGQFVSFNGVWHRRIARLTTSGEADPDFDAGDGADQSVLSIALQPDGKILLCGWFGSVDAVQRPRTARLNSNGSADLSFDPGTGPNGGAERIGVQSDGKVILAGMFTGYNGTGRNRIARLKGTARVGVRAMLMGPYNSGMMNDALRTLPGFPQTEPFTSMGYATATYSPGAFIPSSSILAVNGNNAIVDWLLVEMRPAASPSAIAASRAVLLQRDGDVVDLDGVSTVGFAGLAAGSYCVAVRPRNHLPVMLSPSTPITYGDAISTANFTLPGTQVYDNDARTNIAGTMVLAAGDVTFDGTVKYAGSNNDRDPILTRIGGTVPTATVSGYWREDVNMDGVVKYAGSNNDRDRVLNSIGGSVPTATRVATLP